MRDLVVREALKTMSKDASKRLRELVAAGHEIPYEVQEPGNGSPLSQYAPLTERFIRENVGALRELDSFGAACAAIDAADLAGPYLEELGVKVPPDPRRRSELAGIAYLCRLWGDSTDFALVSERITTGIAELEQGGEARSAEIEVGVPLRGFQMPLVRLELATATIVRADTVEVPPEARLADGSGPWEPTFLAVAMVDLDDEHLDGDEGSNPDRGMRAVEAFSRLITTLRLFKPGGVALGPHAWVRMPIAGGERWRRISTGAGRARPGGYRLAESELGDLAAFSRSLVNRSAPFGRSTAGPTALARAISRFEAGLERGAANEALNDYLLALRFLLEGGGPAELDLGIRVASLCAEPERRTEVKSVVDRALSFERELWSGEPVAGDGEQTPAELATEIEDLTRAILKDAACGHLGGDLRATADEILLADGLAVGEGAADQRGETAEWDGMPLDDEEAEAEPLEEVEEIELVDELRGYEELDEESEADEEPEPVEEPEEEPEPVSEPDEEPEPVSEPRSQPELWFDGVEEGEEEVTVRRTKTTVRRAENLIHRFIEANEEPVDEPDEVFEEQRQELFDEHSDEEPAEPERDEPVARPPAPMLEPAADESSVEGMLQQRQADREEVSDRVAYLFPRPETCEWDTRELGYDRRRGRATAS